MDFGVGRRPRWKPGKAERGGIPDGPLVWDAAGIVRDREHRELLDPGGAADDGRVKRFSGHRS